MSRQRSLRELRAIFSRLKSIRPVRRLAIAGATAGGIYGLYKVRRIYKTHKEEKNKEILRRGLQRLRQEIDESSRKRLEAAKVLKIGPYSKIPKKEYRRAEKELGLMHRIELRQKFPTTESYMRYRYPHLYGDPVGSTNDSDSQKKYLEEASSRYLSEPDVIEGKFKERVRRVKRERTPDVYERMMRRR